MNRPDFSLHLPRHRGDVTFEQWNPFTSGADPRHPGWYDDPYEYAVGVVAGALLGSDGAMRVSVVNRCISLRANMVASLPCLLYRQEGESKERAREHRAYKAVRRQPNAWQTQFQFFRDMQAKHDLCGRAFAKIVDTGGVVTMSPLDPDRVEISQTASGALQFAYTATMGGKPEIILQDEMLYLRDLSLDFYTGKARAALAREAIAVSQAAEQFVGRFFTNDASGRLVFKHPGRFDTPEKRKEFEDYLRSSVMGGRNARRPMLMYGGIEVEEVNGPGDEDFLVDPRTFQAADIARFWGCPGVLIGLEEKTSSWGTGVWEIKQGFIDFTIKPETINWAQSLEAALLTDEEREKMFFEFEFGALLQGNPTEQAQAFATYLERGVLSPNEVRAKLNLNPRPDGDEYQQNVPGSAPNTRDDSPEVPPPDDEDEEPEDEAVEAAAWIPPALMADAADRIAGAIGRGGKEKRAEYVARVLRPLVDAYHVDPSCITEAAQQIDAVHESPAGERAILVLHILQATLTVFTVYSEAA